MTSTYNIIKTDERLISSSERPGLPEEFPSYAILPRIIEKIFETIEIREDPLTKKKEKVTRTVKRIQKQYIAPKGSIPEENYEGVDKTPLKSHRKIIEISKKYDVPLPFIKPREISEEDKKSYELAIQKEKEITAEYERKIRIINGEEAPEPVAEPVKEMPQKSSQNSGGSQSSWGRPNDVPRKRFSVFVRNIPGYYSTQEITDILYEESRSCCATPDKKYTGVKYVKVPEHRAEDDEEKYYIAFVEFYTEDEAQKFIDKRVAIDGIFLNKSWSREK